MVNAIVAVEMMASAP